MKRGELYGVIAIAILAQRDDRLPARRFHFTAIFFTNKLARKRQFQVLDGSSGTLLTEPFPLSATEKSTITAYAPLSRSENFLAAAEAVSELR